MGPSTLRDRLRSVIGAPPPGIGQEFNQAPRRDEALKRLEEALGGRWCEHAGLRLFVIERRGDPVVRHGQTNVGEIATCLDEASAEARLLAGEQAKAPFVFFDLETTGLSGGAGTLAFLIGCAWFDGDGGFVTRQFLLTSVADEHATLLAVARELEAAGALVSFNGKSFDAPLLETRYLFHRLEWPGANLPHLDVLHPARQFWGVSSSSEAERLRSSARDSACGSSDQKNSCSLITLERQLLGARRRGDVAGFEIPRRFFQFLRSGNPLALEDVAEHNRLDLLSLAGLTARIVSLVRSGPDAVRAPQEAVALGRIYARAGLEARALDAYHRAVEMSAHKEVIPLRSLALALRRARRFDEAAVYWQRMLAAPGCPERLDREACEALAVHHEHRVRNLSTARSFALRLEPATNEAARYRVARLEKKMRKSEVSSLMFELGGLET
jgi:uncharacterized protein YprB with RNaseH-like and TPR domain